VVEFKEIALAIIICATYYSWYATIQGIEDEKRKRIAKEAILSCAHVKPSEVFSVRKQAEEFVEGIGDGSLALEGAVAIAAGKNWRELGDWSRTSVSLRRSLDMMHDIRSVEWNGLYPLS